MPYGYNGKILHVDFTSGSYTIEQPEEKWYRTYLGGGLMASYYMLKEMAADTDPLSADNVLCFVAGVLNGTPLSGFNRLTVAAKSPLTGCFGESEAGGYIAPELKFAGFDAVICKGRAAKPVYLWIHDGEVEIRDAGALWGKDNAATRDALVQELEDSKIRVASIGQAGENLSPIACIINELAHVNGRCGLGAVMGSKNLKALVCRGTAPEPAYAEPEKIKEISKWHRKRISSHMPNVNLGKNGTPMHLMAQQNAGILPTHNWKEGVFDSAEDVGLPAYEKILTGRHTCYKCSVACKRVVKLPDDIIKDERYGGPEYETMGSFGPMCGVKDLETIVKAHQRCNAWGFDTISAGATIAFAQELFEEGILTKEDTDGRVVKFGDSEGVLWLLEQMVKNEGIGALLAQGSARAAKIIGRGAEKFVCTIKGQEPGQHDPRGKTSLSLGFALSPTGGDHIECPHEVAFTGEAVSLVKPLGVTTAPKPLDMGTAKVSYFKKGQLTWAMNNALGICNFVVAPLFALSYEKLVQVINAVTGWNVSLYELLMAAERSLVMARIFNEREGFGARDDVLFPRLHESIPEGPAAGNVIAKEAFSHSVKLYYSMMGWDEQGSPTPAKLSELGIDWIIQ